VVTTAAETHTHAVCGSSSHRKKNYIALVRFFCLRARCWDLVCGSSAFACTLTVCACTYLCFARVRVSREQRGGSCGGQPGPRVRH
jgi:hypothetical protein